MKAIKNTLNYYKRVCIYDKHLKLGVVNINCDKWLKRYEGRLVGKRVALFGSTGGIGNALCRYILKLGGTLITVDRNPTKAEILKGKLKLEFPKAEIYSIIADLEDINAVNTACDELERLNVDIVIHNAGAYSIPRRKCSTGFDNVFQINFLSPYYITNRLLPHLAENKGRVVVVGSIAHNYSKTDENDIDFSSRKKASLVYGNAKRHLMFSTLRLSRDNPEVCFAVTHPGITFTNITAHYPKPLFVLIKHPMKVIFMKPRAAALSIVEGMFTDTYCYEWIGPRFFNVWGKPIKKILKTCPYDECERIYKSAKEIYERIGM